MAKARQDESKHHEFNVGISVHICDSTVRIERNKLCALGFFAARLAERWSNNQSDSKSDENYNVYVSQNTCVSEVANSIDCKNNDNHAINSADTFLQLGFKASDLELLIECVELGQISSRLKSDCASIERLIACSDYFTSKEDKFQINKDNLLFYLKNRVPRINSKQRKQLETEASNKLLKCALSEWTRELEMLITGYRKELVSNCDKIKANNIFLDYKSANDLFAATFKPKIIPRINLKRFDISFENFKSKIFYQRLWKQCRYDENYSIISMVPDIVNTMAKYKHFHKIKFEKSEQYSVLQDILIQVVKDVASGKIDPGQIGLDMYSLVLYIDLKFVYDAGWYWHQPCNTFERNFKYFSLDNMKEFLSIILNNHVKYSNLQVTKSSMSQTEINKQNGVMESWYKLIQTCISRCDGAYIVRIANQWFPILIKDGRNDYETKIKKCNVNWIFNVLLPTLGGHNAYQFALYLAKYVVLDGDLEDSDVSARILDFVENETGIEYTVKKHEE